MTRNRFSKRKALLVAAVATVAVLAPAAAATAGSGGLDSARAGTAPYHRLDAAIGAGYSLLTDAAGIACIDNPGVGGMGVHYVNGGLIGDPQERVGAPEALVYEPQANGRLRLVAVEYVVFEADWEAAGNTAPPALFGRQFELVGSPNRYGLPPFYELHAWIWKHNPRGMFDDWNPRVSCSEA
jgi:hypothetical protein